MKQRNIASLRRLIKGERTAPAGDETSRGFRRPPLERRLQHKNRG